jgi:hypothetical protein
MKTNDQFGDKKDLDWAISRPQTSEAGGPLPIWLLALDDCLYYLNSLASGCIRLISFMDMYGLPGFFLYLFGNRAVWPLEAQVLGALQDEDAHTFRRSFQDQCSMISVAVSFR